MAKRSMADYNRAFGGTKAGWMETKVEPALVPDAADRPGRSVSKSGQPEGHPLTSQVCSENDARLVATDLIAASVMAAAFRAESGFSRRPLDP